MSPHAPNEPRSPVLPEELTPAEPQPEAPRAPEAPQLSEGIRAFDQYGREIVVPRQQWAAEVLPNMLAEVRQNPELLSTLILNSLNDGFVQEVAEPAQHLYATDPIPARGTCIWGIVLMQTGRLDQAEQIFNTYLANHPADGSVLLNLAKVQASRNQLELSDATLWRALEVDPNLDNGVGWYASLAADRAATKAAEAAETPEAAQAAAQAAGQQAGTEALLRIATLPGSWRPQLWLARGTLAAGDLESARQLYAEALAHAPRPVPPDALMQISGDLGGSGLLAELIEFTAPHFLPEVHGLPVGNNLIKAYVDTDNLTAATAIKNSLQAFNRPDWQEGLSFWDTELARRQAPAIQPGNQPGAQQQAQIQLGLLRVDGPIWLPPQSPARSLFAAKPTTGPSVTFLGGTAEAPSAAPTEGTDAADGTPSGPNPQVIDAIGRLTRSLPLFFAEQTDLRTAAHGRALIPWAVGGDGQPGGFVVSSARWPDAVAVQMVGEPANRTDYVVSVHLDAEVEPWTADLAFLRTSDGVRIGELQAEFHPADPDECHNSLTQLAQEVVNLLAVLGPTTSPELYRVPPAAFFSAYLLRLEQLLAIRCTTVQGATPMTISGEREILAGELDLCLAGPANLPARLLLVETLGVLTQTRPEVAEQFRENFQRLTTEHPIPALDALFTQTTT